MRKGSSKSRDRDKGEIVNSERNEENGADKMTEKNPDINFKTIFKYYSK